MQKRKIEKYSFMETKFNLIICLYSYLSGYQIKSPFGSFFSSGSTSSPESANQSRTQRHNIDHPACAFTEEINWDGVGGSCQLKFHSVSSRTRPRTQISDTPHPTPGQPLARRGWIWVGCQPGVGRGGRYQISGQAGSTTPGDQLPWSQKGWNSNYLWQFHWF